MLILAWTEDKEDVALSAEKTDLANDVQTLQASFALKSRCYQRFLIMVMKRKVNVPSWSQ